MRMVSTFVLLSLLSAACLAGSPKFTVVHVDTRREHLQLFLRDETGAPFHRFEKLDGWLTSQGKQLTFAMNAGMFKPDYSPVGLFVAHAREVAPLNLSPGRGNFFMRYHPNRHRERAARAGHFGRRSHGSHSECASASRGRLRR
jgi:uncharacterized protein YigE (DUF2233 family)